MMNPKNIIDIEKDEDKTYTEKFIQKQNIQNVDDLADSLKGLHKGKIKLRITILINNFRTKNEVLQLIDEKFILKKYDNFYKILISKIREENDFEGYLWFIPDSQSLIVASYNTQDSFDKYVLNEFLKENENFSLLWINQFVTQQMIGHLASDKSFIMNSFSSEYKPLSEIKSEIRPLIKRGLDYTGIDSFDTYSEIKNRYGLTINKFEGFIENIGHFYFNRNKSLYILRQGEFYSFLDLILWTYKETSYYMDEIKKFKINEFKSLFNSDKFRRLSANLQINFENGFNRENFEDFFSIISNAEELEILSKIDLSFEENPYYNMKIFNRRTLGLFDVTFSKKTTCIFQSFKANYLGIFPILDIVDQCQPKNKILVV